MRREELLDRSGGRLVRSVMRMATWKGGARIRRLRKRLWMRELRSEGYGRNVQRRQSYG